MATIRKAQIVGTLTVTETLDSAPGATGRVLKSDGLNPSALSLTSSTTPPATKFSASQPAIAAGQTTVQIDLTAVAGTQGAFSATGLKLQYLRLQNTSTHSVTLQGAASNGYALLGASGKLIVPAGGVASLYFADGTPDVGASAKLIELVGTAEDTFKLEMVFG